MLTSVANMAMRTRSLLVECHFVPLPSDEAEDRKRRLRALLFKGAVRCAQGSIDAEQRVDSSQDVQLALAHSRQG